MRAFQEDDQPVVSVDAKKKEKSGISRTRAGVASPRRPEEVRAKDFPDKQLGKAIPEGVYDLSRNEGWVSVGIDHDTAEFAVEYPAVVEQMGSPRLPGGGRLLITAEAGAATATGRGCGKWCCRVGGRTGPADFGLPFPAGNQQVEQDRAPPVFLHHEELAWQAASSVASRHRQLDRRHDDEGGIADPAELDTDLYRTGIRISDEQLAEVQLQRATFHGEWNYTIAPQN